MENLYKRVSEIMDKIYNNNSPGNATALEEELAKLLKEDFEECYKKALSEIEVLDDSMEAIPSPGQVVGYIEQLPEAEQEKALAIVNDWFDNLGN
tara:strand:- start:416 stop:700 length:285 start_codon:yes stop_codon:yes gene_type:complete